MRNEVLHAIRQLIRRPGHTLTAALCLAAGLTVSIVTFSILSSLLFGDQPGIADRQRLVRIFLNHQPAGQDVFADPLSLDDFIAMRDGVPALGSIAIEGDLRMAAVGRHDAIGLSGAFVSGSYFAVLGTTPLVGRLIEPADERSGAPAVAVVSEHFWRTHLNASRDAIGQPILLAGRSTTVIGVTPLRFHGIHPLDPGQDDSNGLQVWMPLNHAGSWPGAPSRDQFWLTAIGRLRDGSTVEDARAQFGLLKYPAIVRGRGLGPNDTPVEVLMILGAILSLPLAVLAVSCANVANLQLARSTERTRELAVRLCLGATRSQLVRLLTIETIGFAAVSLAISYLLTTAIIKLSSSVLPVIVTIDWRVAAFSLLLMMGVTFFTGIAPAWLVVRRQAGAAVHSRLRSSLVVAQVAVSLLMICMAAVLLRSLNSMQLEVPAALRSQIVVEFDPAQVEGSPAQRTRFAERLTERIRADARVEAVSLSRAGSIRYGNRYVALVEMTPSWLTVMDLPLLTGRALTGSDGPGAALVSARLAESVAPDASVLGRTLQIDEGTPLARTVEIVGVVADNRTRPMQIGHRPDPVVYTHLPSEITTPFTLRIRTRAVDALSREIRGIVQDIDPRLPWLSMRRGEDTYLDDVHGLRYLGLSIGGLGLIALSLAVTGLYAVMSYVVLLRRREIGVRIAVGADRRDVMRMVLGHAYRLVLAGAMIGLSLALMMAFGLRAVFVGTITPLDPVAFLPPFGLLLLVALAAAAFPALRASKIDPIQMLKQD